MSCLKPANYDGIFTSKRNQVAACSCYALLRVSMAPKSRYFDELTVGQVVSNGQTIQLENRQKSDNSGFSAP